MSKNILFAFLFLMGAIPSIAQKNYLRMILYDSESDFIGYRNLHLYIPVWRLDLVILLGDRRDSAH